MRDSFLRERGYTVLNVAWWRWQAMLQKGEQEGGWGARDAAEGRARKWVGRRRPMDAPCDGLVVWLLVLPRALPAAALDWQSALRTLALGSKGVRGRMRRELHAHKNSSLELEVELHAHNGSSLEPELLALVCSSSSGSGTIFLLVLRLTGSGRLPCVHLTLSVSTKNELPFPPCANDTPGHFRTSTI